MLNRSQNIVQKLISDESGIFFSVHDLSMMTDCLSQYPEAVPNRVRCHGPGIEPKGVNVGKVTVVTVETYSAGKGEVKVIIKNPNGQIEPVDIRFNNHRSRFYTVYTAKMEGMHTIKVTFAGKEIPQSPFSVMVEDHASDPRKVTASGPGLQLVGVMTGKPTYFDIFTKDAGQGQVEVTILDPKDNIRNTVPCSVRNAEDNVFWCEYVARTGFYLVNICFAGQRIPKSPFAVRVIPVKADGRGLQPKGVKVKDTAVFRIYTVNASEDQFEVKVIGPGGAPKKVDVKKIHEDVFQYAYYPQTEGPHVVMISYEGQEIKGSPYEVNVGPCKEPQIRACGSGLHGGVVGQPALFTVETINGETRSLGSSAFDISARDPSPSGVTEDAITSDLDDFGHKLNTVQKEVGIRRVCKDIHIPGSPFRFTVGPFRDHGAHKVHAGGPGLLKGQINEKCEFNVWIQEAGAGSLAICVEGPSDADIGIQDTKDGYCYVQYKVTESGDYRVGIRFNDHPIPDSPYHVFIAPKMGDVAKIQFGEIPTDTKVNKPAKLTIIMNGCKGGGLDGRVITPSGAEDECFIAPLDEGMWALRFIPRENGVHVILIRCNGIHIPESPFRLRIGQDDADPAAVNAYGPVLKEVKTEKTDFVVDTCAAGIGSLAVTIPSKVAMECSEVVKGLLGNIMTEISKVQVETVSKQEKQKDDHLPRFKSDPLKVTSKGKGLKRAHVGKSSHFTVNCGDAGTNVLFCAVYGNKGPCDGIYVRHMGRNLYSINYTIEERRDHVVIVKWGEDHIPGSPFKVRGS